MTTQRLDDNAKRKRAPRSPLGLERACVHVEDLLLPDAAVDADDLHAHLLDLVVAALDELAAAVLKAEHAEARLVDEAAAAVYAHAQRVGVPGLARVAVRGHVREPRAHELDDGLGEATRAEALRVALPAGPDLPEVAHVVVADEHERAGLARQRRLVDEPGELALRDVVALEIVTRAPTDVVVVAPLARRLLRVPDEHRAGHDELEASGARQERLAEPRALAASEDIAEGRVRLDVGRGGGEVRRLVVVRGGVQRQARHAIVLVADVAELVVVGAAPRGGEAILPLAPADERLVLAAAAA
eukprot:CAMPEP_0118876922 /NCGR_PEP_ID=MMETSP1163-20130328/17412_1 /TAXON_ID=124430 /ORGANISM="Phaeomonas parva, Strain CCMP2877" /LENGTH=300 /DNA_ID=CAMNT_0006812577 /DNA_START=303 /DNA_END=1201 /DNA_ORIENTATION=+